MGTGFLPCHGQTLGVVQPIRRFYFCGEKRMTDMILNVQTLPETVFSRISTEKVMIHEENGTIVLTPLVEKRENFDVLFGMFSDGKISTEEYIKEKQFEKELED
jgi:virulence-associated protein VagC